MLVSVEGIYRDGRVELAETPPSLPEGTGVIVTFMQVSEIDLPSQGINREQAEILRTQLSTFSEDWDSPEMNIYDNYDVAKTDREAG
jgi:hypothetical protein